VNVDMPVLSHPAILMTLQNRTNALGIQKACGRGLKSHPVRHNIATTDFPMISSVPLLVIITCLLPL